MTLEAKVKVKKSFCVVFNVSVDICDTPTPPSSEPILVSILQLLPFLSKPWNTSLSSVCVIVESRLASAFR